MLLASRGEISIKAARNHNDRVTYALHCLWAQYMRQIVRREVLAGRFNACDWRSAVAEVDDDTTYQDTRHESKFVAEHEGRQHKLPEKQPATADRPSHKIRHGFVGRDGAVEVKER